MAVYSDLTKDARYDGFPGPFQEERVLGYKNRQGIRTYHCALVIQRSANENWVM